MPLTRTKRSRTRIHPLPQIPPTSPSSCRPTKNSGLAFREKGQRQEEIAVARYRLLCVRQLADRTKDAIDDCRDEAAEWAEDMKDFETASIDWSEPSNQAPAWPGRHASFVGYAG